VRKSLRRLIIRDIADMLSREEDTFAALRKGVRIDD
jgi:hypothetical protein